MREQLQARLEVLQHEFETGQAQLQELERRQANLRQTLLRISGAIQVLEELLTEPNGCENLASARKNEVADLAHNIVQPNHGQ